MHLSRDVSPCLHNGPNKIFLRLVFILIHLGAYGAILSENMDVVVINIAYERK